MAVAAGVMLAMVSCHDRQEQKQSLRDFDTIYTGTGPNTGTGLNLLQQAQLLNDMILFLNSIGLDDLTAQDVLNLRHLIDSLNIHLDVNDTDAVDVDVDVALDIDSDILTGNITDNPLFKSNETWRLRPASPAIDAGISVGLTHDYWGHRITGTPDIGACEFGNYVLFYGGKQLY